MPLPPRRLLAALVLLHLALSADATAQALPSLQSVSVSYNTRKATVRPTGPLLDEIREIDAALVTARQRGATGEQRRLYAKGMLRLSGQPWTPEVDFARSLVLRTDRLVVDPATPWVLRVEQIYAPDIALSQSLSAETVLRRPAAAGRPAETLRDLGRRDGVSRDLRESPLQLPLDLSGVPDGSYQVAVTLRESDRELGTATLTLVVRDGVDAEVARLRAAARTAPEALRPSILYPADRLRLVNLGELELRTFSPAVDFARADSVAQAVAAGRDPFAGRTGDFKRHHYLAAADEILPYRMYVPRGYDPTRPTPLVVILHGLGGTEDALFDGYQGRLQALAEQHGYLLVAPLGYRVDGFYGWTGPAGESDPATAQLAARSEADVLAVIAEVRRAYAVDSAQVFLLGHSMGAIGTWHLAQKFPERWAALAPIAGLGDPSSVERFRHIPQIVVHGDADATVNVAGSRAMVARAKALGATVEYIEVPGGSHTNIAVPNLARIFAFFAEQQDR